MNSRPQTTGTTIRLVNCSKTFPNGTQALAPTSLEFKGGETIVFLGPSGCGKTTLLRVIAGLESPDPGGRVYFDDEDVTAQPIEQRNVGMVFQSYALFPNMNVEENIAYGLKIHKVPVARLSKRVDEMLEMMQITELRDRRITQLSGGQRQRVALARAIAVQPRVLLLDEPLTALDALLRERLRIELDLLLHSLGITGAYVTHDQAEAMAIGDRVAVMNKGTLVQIAPPSRDLFQARARIHRRLHRHHEPRARDRPRRFLRTARRPASLDTTRFRHDRGHVPAGRRPYRLRRSGPASRRGGAAVLPRRPDAIARHRRGRHAHRRRNDRT